MVATKTYRVEIPIEDAPAVTPSTGQYTSATQISITVPEGYTAYYIQWIIQTPTTASTQYTGPIDMPEDRRFFLRFLSTRMEKQHRSQKEIMY